MRRETTPKIVSTFWRYYGGKFRAAPLYPPPIHPRIVEPFAGAAGYALRYPDREVVLVEKYPVVAEVWRYLIGASSEEILRIPEVDHVDDLPGWIPQGARWLIGFCMNDGATSPRRSLSVGRQRLRAKGRKLDGWSSARRALVAAQVSLIRHWRIVEGDYSDAPISRATWFIDPPYVEAGHHYKCTMSSFDYAVLAEWVYELPGQVIACENVGQDWLPFQPWRPIPSGCGRGLNVSNEAIYYQVDGRDRTADIAGGRT